MTPRPGTKCPPGLTNLTKDLATNLLLPRLTITHQPLAGTNDRNPQTIQDWSQVCTLTVHTASWLAHSANRLNYPLTVRPVLQLDPQLIDRLSINDLVVPNVALSFQYLR